MKVFLFSNIRDEYNVEEFVAYHFLLGFDKIILYDHLSKNPLTQIFQSYNYPNLIIYRENSEECDKKMFMDRSLFLAHAHKADWFTHIDGDEYIVLKKHPTVQAFLQDFSQVALSWLLFGSNHLEKNPSPFLIDTFLRCQSTPIGCGFKTFIRTNKAISSHDPHNWSMHPGEHACNVLKQNIGMPYALNYVDGMYELACVYHYMHQSYKTYLRRKIHRTMDALRDRTYPMVTREEYHKLYNDVINTYLRDTFSERIKQYIAQHRN
jgi:hypothetical protein